MPRLFFSQVIERQVVVHNVIAHTFGQVLEAQVSGVCNAQTVNSTRGAVAIGVCFTVVAQGAMTGRCLQEFFLLGSKVNTLRQVVGVERSSFSFDFTVTAGRSFRSVRCRARFTGRS